MKRFMVSALVLLSGCGIIGPSQNELEAAIQNYYINPSNISVSAVARRLQGAPIAAFEGCQPNKGVFTCVVTFDGPEGRAIADLWVVRRPEGGWQVRNLVVRGARA